MRTPNPLPDAIAGRPFRAAEGASHGVTRQRMRSADLLRPFHGVRAHSIGSLLEAAQAYAERMDAGHVFAAETAARLWGLPLTSHWRQEEPLVIARPHGATRGTARGTRQIAYAAELLDVGAHRGLPVLGPVATSLTLARRMPHEPLVHVVDALLTDSWRYPDLELPTRPHADPVALEAFLARCRGHNGVPALRAALRDARQGVDSRWESVTRRAIVLAGFPEPEVHPLVLIDGRERRPDLGYRDLRIAIEFEGDGHRERRQWQRDIGRHAAFEAEDWIVVRATSADVRGPATPLIHRLSAAFARRA